MLSASSNVHSAFILASIRLQGILLAEKCYVQVYC